MDEQPYQPVDGPVAQEPIVLAEDLFNTYNHHVDIRITSGPNQGRIAVYRRRRHPNQSWRWASSSGNPHSASDSYVTWVSYSHEAPRALYFVGYKN